MLYSPDCRSNAPYRGHWTGYDASHNEPLDLLQYYKLYRRSLRNLNHESTLKSIILLILTPCKHF